MEAFGPGRGGEIGSRPAAARYRSPAAAGSEARAERFTGAGSESPLASAGVRPEPSSGGRAGLASVIVPCWDQVAFTRQCLQALFRCTRPGSWELIVVDNGSTDGTAAYLAGVQATVEVPITVITNARNVGFPAAVNQGLREASGEYLVLLNNDAVVTEGWLEHLVALTAATIPAMMARQGRGGGDLLHGEHGKHGRKSGGRRERCGGRVRPVASPSGAGPSEAGIGLVGPMSNYAAPPQLVEGVPYRDLDEMHAFAARWRDQHRGRWFTAGKLSGFCLLMTRVGVRRDRRAG